MSHETIILRGCNDFSCIYLCVRSDSQHSWQLIIDLATIWMSHTRWDLQKLRQIHILTLLLRHLLELHNLTLGNVWRSDNKVDKNTRSFYKFLLFWFHRGMPRLKANTAIQEESVLHMERFDYINSIGRWNLIWSPFYPIIYLIMWFMRLGRKPDVMR